MSDLSLDQLITLLRQKTQVKDHQILIIASSEDKLLEAVDTVLGLTPDTTIVTGSTYALCCQNIDI